MVQIQAGLERPGDPRDISFCGHAILSTQTLVIPDATLDERFRDNPLVTGEPWVRFYAAHPITGPKGHRIGTLCVIDRQPRDFQPADSMLLRDLAALLEEVLHSKRRREFQVKLMAEVTDLRY